MKEHEQQEQPSRRGMTAALLGGAAALALLPKSARSEISFGELRRALSPVVSLLRNIEGLTAEQLDFLREIFRFIQLGLSGAWFALINRILALIGRAGEDSFTMEGNAPGAMERSYPREPITTPLAQQEATMLQAEAIQRRADESTAINSAAASTSGERQTMAAEIMAAGLESGSIPGLLAAQNALLVQLIGSVEMLVVQTAANGSQHVDGVMLTANAKHQAMLKSLDYLGESGREISPPVDRPVQ